ncbi:MAG: hypothetical protein ACFFG0_48175 [Candidatus Thorarchaeota archaeon]
MYIEMSGVCEICGKKNKVVRSYKLLFGSSISSFSIGNFIEDPPLLNKQFYICIECRRNKKRILEELIKVIKLDMKS